MENTRNTRQKQLILSLLKEADRPMSINEIHSHISHTLPKIAKSTIYRNIDNLLHQNLIDKYHFNDNEVFYRIREDEGEHKHFVICDKCKNVYDLPSCPIHEIEHTMEKEGFIIRDHQIQINGICRRCANEAARTKLIHEKGKES